MNYGVSPKHGVTQCYLQRYKQAHPALTPASKACKTSWRPVRIYLPGGMEGRVDLGELITPWLGVEPIDHLIESPTP